MKKPIYFLAAAVLTVGSILSACESKEKKVENAEQKVDTDQQKLSAAKDTLNTEFSGFRADGEKRIADNDRKIERLKEELTTGGGTKPLDPARRDKIEQLKKRNADLRARLDKYDKAQSDFITFRNQFDKDMASLDTAYAELDRSKK